MGALSFQPDLIDAIRAKRKSETRRIQKLNETFGPNDLQRVVTWKGDRMTAKWVVGRDYALVPGRGIPASWVAPGGGGVYTLTQAIQMFGLTGDALTNKLYAQGFVRESIRILSIRQEPVGAIDDAGARREGVADRAAFIELWDRINGRDKRNRFSADPMVWVIGFQYNEPLPF